MGLSPHRPPPSAVRSIAGHCHTERELDDDSLRKLRLAASEFRRAIEQARTERAPGALPYFPEGACRMTSRLFGQHLTRQSNEVAFGRPLMVSGIVPGSEPAARHYWIEVGNAVVDLTADAFGEPAVVVGSPTPFHQSLTARVEEDFAQTLRSLGDDEAARLGRQLAAVESRLPGCSPAAG